MTAPAALSVKVILGSTRDGRFGDKPAHWILGEARQRPGVDVELLDLRDYPLPFYDRPTSPVREGGVYASPEVTRWAQAIVKADAFIVVSPEYNHGYPAVLKNAFDHIFPEWAKKPIGFVSYGNAGGARGVEQLRLMLIELHVAPIRSAVHIGRSEFMDLLVHGKTFGDFPHLEHTANGMLDDLLWWATTLRAGRARVATG